MIAEIIRFKIIGRLMVKGHMNYAPVAYAEEVSSISTNTKSALSNLLREVFSKS
jgi:hypothetical protein